MPSPQFGSNAYIKFGGGIGVVRATTDISLGRNSNAKVTPTTTGDVGFSTGVRMAEVTCTIACTIGSQQQRDLNTLYENGTPFDYDAFDGNIHHIGRGVMDSLTMSSKTNDVIEYSLKISAADGKSS